MNRNQTLDVSRGFLSWTVVVVHVVWLAGYHGIIQHHAGVYAVDGFIILSGFVIAQLLLTKNEPYGLYIFRRFKRLFPGLHFLSRDRLVSAAFYFRDCSERVAPRGERIPVFLVASRCPRKLDSRIGANRLVAAIAACFLTAGMEYQLGISALFVSAAGAFVAWALRASRVRCPGDRQSHDARTAGCLET